MIAESRAIQAPSLELASLLRALLEGAQLALSDQLGRSTHLHSPFRNPIGLEPALRDMPPLEELVNRLWSAGQSVPATAAEAILDAETLDELVAGRLLVRDTDGEGVEVLRSPWRLSTYLQRYLLASAPTFDHAAGPGDLSVYLGPESTFFGLIVLGAARCERALDLGTGAGLLATLLPAETVVAVELDPVAASVARFNMALNGLDHVEVREGDLFWPVMGEQFDLIVSTPPCLPAPPEIDVPSWGNGGHEGDAVLRRVIAELPARLAPDGRALLFAAAFGTPERPHLTQSLEGLDPTRDITIHVTDSRSQEAIAKKTVDLWESLGAGRDRAWKAWGTLIAERPFTHQHSFVVDVGPGSGRVVVRRPARI